MTNSAPGIFLDNLSEIIERRHWDLLRVTNSRLVTLFWGIGKELNTFFECERGKDIKYNNSIIYFLSSRLVANSGSYFSEKNLRLMSQFAEQFSNLSQVEQIAPLLSWEHLAVLLKIKDLEKKLFYMVLAVEQGLSVHDLRKQILKNAYEKEYNSKVRNVSGRTLTHSLNKNLFLNILQASLKQQAIDTQTIKNFFTLPLISSFRSLMEVPQKQVSIIKEKKKINDSDKELYAILCGHIEKFRYQHNRWLNAYLNLTFWEIGHRINRETLLSNKKQTTYKDLAIHNSLIRLRGVYGKTFSEIQLNNMTKFAEQIADPAIAARISYLVRWNYIIVLLSVDEIEAKLFYAILSAKKGLSVTNLRKKIQQNAYEYNKRGKKGEQKEINALYNATSKTTIKKSGNSIIKETTKFINLENAKSNDLTVTNILKNPYFLNFVTAFKGKTT